MQELGRFCARTQEFLCKDRAVSSAGCCAFKLEAAYEHVTRRTISVTRDVSYSHLGRSIRLNTC